MTNWTGPKVSQDRVNNAGVLALIGIRQIHQGAPHMSQECANELVSSFRARLIAELTCGELEPSAEAFAAMAPAEAEVGSQFFADALYGTEPYQKSVSSSRNTSLDDHPASPHPVSAGEGPNLRQRVAPPIHTKSSSLVRPLSAGTRVQPGRDDRRTILGHLCEAVLSHRAIRGSGQLSLAVL